MADMLDNREILELAGYLDSINSRIQALQRVSSELSSQLNLAGIGLESKRESMLRELREVWQGAAKVKLDVRLAQKSVIGIISELKGSLKAEDLVRFKKRIELWGLENFVTRNDARRTIDEAFPDDEA